MSWYATKIRHTRVSQLRHYWNLGPDHSSLWETVFRIVGCFATPFAFTHAMPVWEPQMSFTHCQRSPGDGGNCPQLRTTDLHRFNRKCFLVNNWKTHKKFSRIHFALHTGVFEYYVLKHKHFSLGKEAKNLYINTANTWDHQIAILKYTKENSVAWEIIFWADY